MSLSSAGRSFTAQIFPPASDFWLRLTMILFALSIAMLGIGGWARVRSPWETQGGLAQHQPIPFSHKHHVGDDGIDCRYCHTSVETSARAGLPATHICMTCHSQLWTGAEVLAPVRESMATGRPLVWHRVSQVPDYVYFNHSIHVARGVGCVECHGRIDKMPLTWRAKPFQMQFCLDCHRDPASRLRPPQLVTQMEPLDWPEAEKRRYGAQVMAKHRIDPKTLTNCEMCHR